MHKFLIFILLIILAPLLGGLYGIIHDQLTYSISPEYYTKFKFFQFGLLYENDPVITMSPRAYVSIVGFLATWWMGLPIGFILGLVGLIHVNARKMFIYTFRALLLTIAIAFFTGIIGLAWGHFYLSNLPLESFKGWYFPDNLIDYKNFIKVGSMHNFSYAGGLIGLIFGIIYSKRKKGRVNQSL